MSTIHSIVQAKNLSITIVSSLSLRHHTLQILSLTILLHLSILPAAYTLPLGISDILATALRSPFIIHPAPMVAFLKPKLTYLEKQKLAIP